MNNKYTIGKATSFIDMYDFPIYKHIGLGIKIKVFRIVKRGKYNNIRKEALTALNKLNSGKYRVSLINDEVLIRK